VAPWTLHSLILRLLLHDVVPKAVHVNLMETICTLQHVQVGILLVVFADELVTKHAQTFFAQLLHLLVDCGGALFFIL
jgi:hypothetical protein